MTMTKTTAAVVSEPEQPFTWQEVELDAPRADEVLVRMVATGICHTDLSVRDGLIPFPMPAVLGHEGAGIVEETGSGVRSVAPGDPVLLSFTSCGACRNCAAGHPAYCDSFLPLNLLGGARPDGTSPVHGGEAPVHAHFFGQSSLARHAIADERSVVKVEPDVPLEVLAPLGCGVQTGAGTVLNVLRPTEQDTLVLFGMGGVGLAALMAAVYREAGRIIVVDLDPDRLALSRELGAHRTVDARDEDAVAAVASMTGGRGAEFSVECTGAAPVLRQAIDVLAPHGAVAVIGAPAMGTTVDVDVNFMLNGRRIIGITEGDSVPQEFLPELVELYRRGRLPLESMVRQYPYTDIERAVADMATGSVIKPVLRF